MQKTAFKRVPLDAKQRRMWSDTLAALTWVAPGFTHIIYTMLANTDHKDEIALFTEEIQFAAATDGLQLIFKPTVFFQKSLMKRVFMVLHEVMHEILNHVRAAHAFHRQGKITVGGRTLPFSGLFSNVVQDLVINATLIASKLGEFDPDWLYDKDLNADEKSWVELYFDLWREPPKPPTNPKGKGGGQQGKGQKGPGTPTADLPGPGKPCDDGDPGKDQPAAQGRGKQFDEHLDPGEGSGMDAHEVPERNEIAWEQAINTAMEIQRAQGKLPAALEHFFNSVLNPVVDWTEHVRGELVRMSGSGAYDWQKLDRRLVVRGIGAPGMTGHSVGLIVVGGDTSGSIFGDKTLLARFIGEMAGMLEDLNPTEIHSVWCDTEVKRVDVLKDADDLRAVISKIPGGGGTSFVPVFKYIEENDLCPDALIYLTDMAGTFPDHEPDFPVIWGNIDPAVTSAPFGKVVFIPTHQDKE